MTHEPCEHIESLHDVKSPLRLECFECAKIGARWVQLRVCQTCGVTLCCDSSPHRHASAHWRGTGHPVIASAEIGDHWLYCYAHDAMTEYKLPGERHVVP
jgi:hypothetical protein